MIRNASDKVSAVVVTWNSSKDIVRCLDSLLNQTHDLEKVVVVDNASSDGTPDLITSRFPQVTLERKAENEGFARGNNIGIARLSTDWILTLNPDAHLASDWVEKLLSFTEGKPRIGIVGGKLYKDSSSLDESRIIDSAGIEIFRSRRVRDLGMGEPDGEQWNKPMRVFGICAAAALYRRDMMADVSIRGEIFPERFFSYYEDADLAWRAWRRGWEAWMYPDATGWHMRGGSPVGDRFSRYMTHRNRLGMIARNESLLDTLTGFPELVAHEILMLLRVVRYPYLIKAVIEALSHLALSIRDRKRLQSTNPIPPPFRKGIGF